MSEASRDTVNIPTWWPHDRQKTRKPSKLMQEENLTDDSTDVWYDIVQKYEKRPMESTLLLSAEMHIVHSCIMCSILMRFLT
jgi:hypothetical protein